MESILRPFSKNVRWALCFGKVPTTLVLQKQFPLLRPYEGAHSIRIPWPSGSIFSYFSSLKHVEFLASSRANHTQWRIPCQPRTHLLRSYPLVKLVDNVDKAHI